MTAAFILDNLRRRGVILVEIDSGAKSSDAKQHELLTPLQGLSNATQAIASEERDRSIKRLNRLLAKTDKAAPGSGHGKSKSENESFLLHCRFLCNHADESDVMTGWALGPDDKAHVLATFFWEFNTFKKQIVKERYPQWRVEQDFEKPKKQPETTPERRPVAEQVRREAQWRAQQQRLYLQNAKK